jgi:hypothetical protein
MWRFSNHLIVCAEVVDDTLTISATDISGTYVYRSMYLVYVKPSSRRVKICSIPFFRKCHLETPSAGSDQLDIRCIKIIASWKIFPLRRHDAESLSGWIKAAIARLHQQVGRDGDGRDVLSLSPAPPKAKVYDLAPGFDTGMCAE